MKRVLVALALLLLAVPARAGDVQQVAAALRSAPVYQAPGVDLVDVPALTSELSSTSPPVLVAVLPATAASTPAQAKQLAIAIGTELASRDDVVLVITANGKFGTGQGDLAGAHGVDSAAALTQELKGLQSLSKDALTAFVLSFSERIANQVATPAPGVQNGPVPVVTGGGSGTGWLVGGSVVVLLALAAAAVLVPRRVRASRGA